MTLEDNEEITLGVALNRYLAEVSQKLSPQSIARHERLARTVKKGVGGDTALNVITPLLLDSYRQKRLKGASASTVEKDFVFLSALFEHAIANWQLGIDVNPVNNLGSTARSHRRDRRLRDGEQMRLLAACDRLSNPFLGLVVRIALSTALKKSEILVLKYEDVDLQKRIVIVPRTPSRAPRTVPLTQKAVKLFAEAMNQENRPDDVKLIFYGELGRYESRKPYAIDRIFRQVLITARMKTYRFSDLRFEAISRFKEAGFNDLEIIAIAGTRTIRGRRHPQQQIAALLARMDELGVGVEDDNLATVTKRDENLIGKERSTTTTKRGARAVSRGSFGVAVGIKPR
ncbi:MAG: tyrosine-type recombinase/integrase [Magnetococcales bacterium]|nr:tyrosine-type recombinase/integrase [Magnetococcales bacterium]